MIFPDSFPPESKAEYALVYEVRAIHDAATLRSSDYRAPSGSAWLVAVITPQGNSGLSTIPGAYIESETGRFVVPKLADMVVVKKGIWQAIATSDPSAPRSGNYSWNEPLEQKSRLPSPEDFYSPFAYGGTVVFRPEPTATGIEQFGSCKLIFPEWGSSVGEAFQAAPQLAKLAESAATQPTSLAEIGKMVTGDNGVLATMAFRSLLQGSHSFASRASGLFKATDVRKLSTFVYLSLAMEAKDRSEWVAQLGKLIHETQEAPRLLAIAYAAFAINLFDTQDSTAVEAAHRLLGELHKRVQELRIPTPENSPWYLIFQKSGSFNSG